jgi:hypothetical protein
MTADIGANGTPISNLDARLDDLVRVVVMVPDIQSLIAGLESYELILRLLSLDDLGAVQAIASGNVWSAMAAVVREVHFLGEVDRNGGS